MFGKISLLTKLVPLLKKYWKIIIIGLVIAGAAWHYNNLVNENEELKRQVQTAESTIEDYQEQEQDFIDTINEYNEKTQELEEQTQRLEEKANESRERRLQAERELNEKLRELDNIEIGESCEDSMNFLRDQAKQLQENNENE